MALSDRIDLEEMDPFELFLESDVEALWVLLPLASADDDDDDASAVAAAVEIAFSLSVPAPALVPAPASRAGVEL